MSPAGSKPTDPGVPGPEPAAARRAHRAAGAVAAQGRAPWCGAGLADRDADRRTGREPGPVRCLPDHVDRRTPARHRPLAQGRSARSDPAGGLPPPREDHPLRPRAHPGAGRARARRGRARHLPRLRHGRAAVTRAGFLQRGRRDAGVRAVLHRARLARVGRHRPRRPRLRDEVLHRRGQLRPGRQQHPGVLHPGRHQVPRPHPRRQAAPGPRDPAGADAPTTRSGTSSRCTPRRPTTSCGHVRPRHPALVPDDGGLRRPHLPAGRTPTARPRW